MTRQDEHNEQVKLFAWAHWAGIDHPELSLMFAIPNGGRRDAVTGARLKEEGVKAGVPDVFLPVIRQGLGGLFIELKAGTNKPSAKQSQWLDELRRAGYAAEAAWGAEEAKTLIMRYLEGGYIDSYER